MIAFHSQEQEFLADILQQFEFGTVAFSQVRAAMRTANVRCSIEADGDIE